MSDINTSTTTPLDEEHDLVVVDETRAWVAEHEGGRRVSVTWIREPGETLEAFLLRADGQAFRVMQFMSPAN